MSHDGLELVKKNSLPLNYVNSYDLRASKLNGALEPVWIQVGWWNFELKWFQTS